MQTSPHQIQSRTRKGAVKPAILKIRQILQILLITLLTLSPTPAQKEGDLFRFEVTSRLVIVNVAVTDRDGKPIENLTPDDFKLYEDKAPQKISVFEYQRLAAEPLAALAPTDPQVAAQKRELDRDITPSKPGEIRYKDRRLMVLYFDFSSMPPADQIRAQKAAVKFLDEHMTASDLVSIMAYTNELTVLQDFTDDRELLRDVVSAFRIGEASELAEMFETDEELLEDTGNAFTIDETEFNIFNTDQKLSALADAARMLSSLPEKKALVYFASGVGRTGTENDSQLRSTINAAVRANVSFYAVDARGLVAEAPAGDARAGSSRGTGLYSGRAQGQRRQRFNNQQETLFALAEDTGGKALLDTNDLTLGIIQAQEAISSYYILGYYTTNPAMDGRFRRVKVEIPEFPRAKLDYRSGYFGPKDFSHFTSTDRERQLEEALLLEDPITDLTLALEVNYFRLAGDRYFIPVAVKIPGSEIELAKKGGSEKTRFDFIGQVRDQKDRLVGTVRDEINVELTGEKSEILGKRQLQYDSGFTLAPGNYNLKFLARENETGKMGTFETNFEVPDLLKVTDSARISSVVWAAQREPLEQAVGGVGGARRMARFHPLVHDGVKLIPSITRVFRRDQTLYVFFELYEPGTGARQGATTSLSASLSFFQGDRKVFESEPVHVNQAPARIRSSAPVEFQLALNNLQPGRYTCQLNVIDEIGQKFAFRRAPLVVIP